MPLFSLPFWLAAYRIPEAWLRFLQRFPMPKSRKRKPSRQPGHALAAAWMGEDGLPTILPGDAPTHDLPTIYLLA